MRVTVGDFIVTRDMKSAVTGVMHTGRISYGPRSKAFEHQFGQLHNSLFTILSNSGTSSLQVALQAMKQIHGWADGDEVIIPATTFVATMNIVLHNNMTPVLVDVEPDYYGIDAGLIPPAITDRTRAIIPVHTFGQPADMKSIKLIADHHELKIIEDSCECMFATNNGQPVGSIGDIGCFSTYVAHIITTGVGGLATTSNPEYAALMRSLVNHGRDIIYTNIDDDEQVTEEIISRRFQFNSIGHSFRITELEAALGLAQLKNWTENIAARQHNADLLTQGLRPYQKWLQLPRTRRDASHSYMMYPIVARNTEKQGLVTYLETNGIETRDMLPLINQPAYDGLIDQTMYPVASWLLKGGFYIGCHPGVSEGDVEYVVHKIRDYYA